MQMDSRIILMGQPVNALAALDAGTQAAGRAGMVGHQGDLLSLYREQGPGIMAGDANALNALSSLDPQAALGIRQTQQTMRIQEERLAMARAEGARVAEAQAAQLSADQLAQEREQIAQGLAMAVPALRSGNLDGVNQIFQSAGLPSVQTPEEAAYIIASFEGAMERFDAMQGVLGTGGGGDLSEAEQEIQRLESIGIPREVAIRIKEGVFTTSRDPVTGEVIVLDLANQSVVMRVNQDGEVVTGNGPSAPPASSDVAPAASPQLSFGDTAQPTNAENAFGLRGMVGGAANAVSDFLGADPIAPEIAENQRFFRVLEEDLLVDLSQAYGRQPAAALMERLRRLAPNVGTMEGANSAVGELRALRDRFALDLEAAQRSLGRRMSTEDRAAAQQRVSGLEAAIRRIDAGLSRFSGVNPQGGNTTQSGVTWSIVE